MGSRSVALGCRRRQSVPVNQGFGCKAAAPAVAIETIPANQRLCPMESAPVRADFEQAKAGADNAADRRGALRWIERAWACWCWRSRPYCRLDDRLRSRCIPDALESTVNVVTAVVALVAGATPPGRRMRNFGMAMPGRVFRQWSLAALLLRPPVLILGLGALRRAAQSFTADRPCDQRRRDGDQRRVQAFLVSRSRTCLAPSLTADGRHLFSDVISTQAY